MRDRTASRNHSAARDEFRRVNQQRRYWAKRRGYIERLRREWGCSYVEAVAIVDGVPRGPVAARRPAATTPEVPSSRPSPALAPSPVPAPLPALAPSPAPRLLSAPHTPPPEPSPTSPQGSAPSLPSPPAPPQAPSLSSPPVRLPAISPALPQASSPPSPLPRRTCVRGGRTRPALATSPAPSLWLPLATSPAPPSVPPALLPSAVLPVIRGEPMPAVKRWRVVSRSLAALGSLAHGVVGIAARPALDRGRAPSPGACRPDRHAGVAARRKRSDGRHSGRCGQSVRISRSSHGDFSPTAANRRRNALEMSVNRNRHSFEVAVHRRKREQHPRD